MRALILAVAALLLAACSTFAPSNPMPSGRAVLQMDAVATLATIGTCEYELAPLYTRNALARRTAARDLERGRINVEQAKAAQSTADAVRALLDRACPKGTQAKEVDRDAAARADALLKRIAR